MMYSPFNIHQGFGVFYFGLHVLFMLAFSIGILFLLFWAFKNLSEKQLWKSGWMLVLVGAVGCVLTLASVPFYSFGSCKSFGMTSDRNMMWLRERSGDDGSQVKEEVIRGMMNGGMMRQFSSSTSR
jgi:hypothetical protein